MKPPGVRRRDQPVVGAVGDEQRPGGDPADESRGHGGDATGPQAQARRSPPAAEEEGQAPREAGGQEVVIEDEEVVGRAHHGHGVEDTVAGGSHDRVEAPVGEAEAAQPVVLRPERARERGEVLRLPHAVGEGPARVAVAPGVQGENVASRRGAREQRCSGPPRSIRTPGLPRSGGALRFAAASRRASSRPRSGRGPFPRGESSRRAAQRLRGPRGRGPTSERSIGRKPRARAGDSGASRRSRAARSTKRGSAASE